MDIRQAPRRHSLARRTLVRSVELAFRALGGRAWYRTRFLGPGRLVERHETLRVAGFPRALRVAQLSDFHAGSFLGPGDLKHALERVAALAPDLIALTGDFITHAPRELERVLDDLALLRAPLGVFAVLGNHDYRGRQDPWIVEQLAARGVRTLRNEGVRLELAGGALCVVGVEDLEESRRLDFEAARACVRAGDFELVLSHHPALARHAARERCIAVLSGHTHGTQLDLPLLRRAGPAHPGLRVAFGATTLIVSRGLGAIGLPLRWGAPAEVVIVNVEPV